MTNGFPNRYDPRVLNIFPDRHGPKGWPASTEWTRSRGIFGWPGPDNNSALSLLKESAFWLDAELSPRRNNKLVNLGSYGSALDSQLGSAAVVETVEPTDLVWSSTNYVFLPGVAGNAITCTAPAGTASYMAYPIDGTTPTTGVAAPGAFTFDTLGNWIKVDLLDGLSSVLASFEANTLVETSVAYTDAFAVTWALTSATTGKPLTLVTRSKLVFNNDDYLQAPHCNAFDFNKHESFTVTGCIKIKDNAIGGINPIICQRNPSSAKGWVLRLSAGSFTPTMLIHDGVTFTQTTSAALSTNTVHFVYGIVDRNRQLMTVGSGNGSNSTSVSSRVDLISFPTTPLHVGRFDANYSRLELYSSNVWRRALNTDELATLADYYNAV